MDTEQWWIDCEQVSTVIAGIPPYERGCLQHTRAFDMSCLQHTHLSSTRLCVIMTRHHPACPARTLTTGWSRECGHSALPLWVPWLISTASFRVILVVADVAGRGWFHSLTTPQRARASVDTSAAEGGRGAERRLQMIRLCRCRQDGHVTVLAMQSDKPHSKGWWTVT